MYLGFLWNTTVAQTQHITSKFALLSPIIVPRVGIRKDNNATINKSDPVDSIFLLPIFIILTLLPPYQFTADHLFFLIYFVKNPAKPLQ